MKLRGVSFGLWHCCLVLASLAFAACDGDAPGASATDEEVTDEAAPTDDDTPTDEVAPTDEDTPTDEDAPTDDDPPACEVCDNGGVCDDGACVCPDEWTGPTCAVDVNECEQNACGGGSACTNAAGGYACACLDHFASEDGRNCVSTSAAMELLVFYDESAARQLGPNPEAKLHAIFLRAKEIMDTNLTSPRLTLSLSGVVRFAPMPASIPVRACDTADLTHTHCTGCWIGPTPANCADSVSSSASEVDAQRMLDGFKTYTRSTKLAALQAKFGAFDQAVLLTGMDLPGDPLELSGFGDACSPSGVSVLQVRGNYTNEFHGALLAHSLGHAMQMGHDTAGAPYIMAPAMTLPPNTAFSPASINSYTTWLGNLSSNCFLDEATHAWAAATCGNGVLDAGEGCDPGVEDDTCCSDTCQLEPSCLCANTEPCCQNGAPRSAGHVCRAAADATCDLPDTCDGQSGVCRDVYQPAGGTCVDDGYCFRKQCVSRTQQCRAPNIHRTPPWMGCETSTRCDRVDCKPVSSCNTWWSIPAQDGTICGVGMQCTGGVCTSTSGLNDYAWAPDAWSACVNGTSTRTLRCVDETGTLSQESACVALPRPVTSRTCVP